MWNNVIGITSLSNVITGPIINKSNTKGVIRVSELTVIPYKHNRCRHPKIIGRLDALHHLTNDLKGGKWVSRHDGGPIHKFSNTGGETTCVSCNSPPLKRVSYCSLQ